MFTPAVHINLRSELGTNIVFNEVFFIHEYLKSLITTDENLTEYKRYTILRYNSNNLSIIIFSKRRREEGEKGRNVKRRRDKGERRKIRREYLKEEGERRRDKRKSNQY